MNHTAKQKSLIGYLALFCYGLGIVTTATILSIADAIKHHEVDTSDLLCLAVGFIIILFALLGRFILRNDFDADL